MLATRRAPQQMGGLKKLFRKVGPLAAAAAAVAVGQPELAVTAAQVTKQAAGKGKAPALVEPPVQDLPPAGFWANLAPADRQVLTIGGALLGGLVLARLFSGRR